MTDKIKLDWTVSSSLYTKAIGEAADVEEDLKKEDPSLEEAIAVIKDNAEVSDEGAKGND